MIVTRRWWAPRVSYRGKIANQGTPIRARRISSKEILIISWTPLQRISHLAWKEPRLKLALVRKFCSQQLLADSQNSLGRWIRENIAPLLIHFGWWKRERNQEEKKVKMMRAKKKWSFRILQLLYNMTKMWSKGWNSVVIPTEKKHKSTWWWAKAITSCLLKYQMIQYYMERIAGVTQVAAVVNHSFQRKTPFLILPMAISCFLHWLIMRTE